MNMRCLMGLAGTVVATALLCGSAAIAQAPPAACNLKIIISCSPTPGIPGAVTCTITTKTKHCTGPCTVTVLAQGFLNGTPTSPTPEVVTTFTVPPDTHTVTTLPLGNVVNWFAVVSCPDGADSDTDTTP